MTKEDEAVCQECQWRGVWSDALKFPEVSIRILCPNCGSAELVQSDGVSSQDYLDQNPRERVRE